MGNVRLILALLALCTVACKGDEPAAAPSPTAPATAASPAPGQAPEEFSRKKAIQKAIQASKDVMTACKEEFRQGLAARGAQLPERVDFSVRLKVAVEGGAGTMVVSAPAAWPESFAEGTRACVLRAMPKAFTTTESDFTLELEYPLCFNFSETEPGSLQ